MKIALGQVVVGRNWEDNAREYVALMVKARESGAKLLVLPEGVIGRDPQDVQYTKKSAQALDGPFMQRMLEASKEISVTLMMTVHVPTANERVGNIFVVVQNGRIVAQYKKLHLYDAFVTKESDNVEPGHELPPIVEIDGLKMGLLTCYDVRFPDLAGRLALDGAQVLVVPAAWVKGPMKEAHWEVMVTARALENTCYVLACGECGPNNIGQSMVVDPLGVATARAAEGPGLIFAEIDVKRIEHARKVLPVLQNRRFRTPALPQ